MWLRAWHDRCLYSLLWSAIPANRLGSAPAFPSWGWGRHILLRLSVPSAPAVAKGPMRVLIAAAVFAFGMLAGAGIAAWLMPPA